MYNALQIGLTVADLELVTIGMLNDLACEMNDDTPRMATQSDFDKF